ncbi:SGNH/GDSL hydrolase family protein [Myxococcus llanfairpwllgwyngyllgogerychwyrndrobwllllantysiliogogogochensis]|uniref:SGNH/GDSL hydrolase family protein n=1 Tax=Myxococcus llanfairpwllgwyngyllgogerychwyrndrobwllllantysiliogogogochensis TaxID=2590453 RepID=A0A540X9N6_9BACT|nr:SGNH/GDSL hydrolase family protein [Myxococcus llanfairpwllgwyngyllgogerychwyrndrobwllllantysiliogogogochensis]TQF18016.1 SGNH/GDSL hydrolase family protein [Myxococcus llanfairpwllgwyngyllgogerychwyrndrobwllllantysiliogogogochensis]
MKKSFLTGWMTLAVLAPLHASAQSAIVAFGDSLSDNGNNGVSTSGPNTQPASQIYGVWVKQLATALGLPLTASDDGGTNYARGGALTSGMTTQVNSYLNKAPLITPTTLFTLWGGANDISRKVEDNPLNSTAIKAAAAQAASNVEAQIRKLVAAGAKKIVWVNLPPLEKTPKARIIPGGLGTYVFAPPVTHFNSLWAQALKRLRIDYPTVTFYGVDAHKHLNLIIASPSTYGLTNVKDSCEGKSVNPDKYLFWDLAHPTSYGHSIFADLVYDLVSDIPGFGAPFPMDPSVMAPESTL